MKTGTVILLVGGVAVVGVGGYFLVKKMSAASIYQPNPSYNQLSLAQLQSQYGAKAVANSGSSPPTLGTVAGSYANAFLPGSGAAVSKITDKAASTAVKAIKSLKFW